MAGEDRAKMPISAGQMAAYAAIPCYPLEWSLVSALTQRAHDLGVRYTSRVGQQRTLYRHRYEVQLTLRREVL